MNQLQDISNIITQIVETSPSKTILGVRLGSLLKQSFPSFHPVLYQCRNLRQFIRTHVPAVSECGHSGLDVIYTIGNLPTGQVEKNPAPHSLPVPNFIPLPTSGYNWKAYSNPAYPFTIAANRETGELKVIPESHMPDVPWLVIPKPSGDVHRDIANEFVSSLSEPLRTNLTRLLFEQKWYVQFSPATVSSGVRTQWSAFRRAKLISRFKEALRNLNIPSPLPPSQPASAQAQRPSSQATIQTQPIPACDEVSFRALVQRIVAELPMSELRLLRLPVGVVFDALKR